MRQLITRVDDELHARLKERAAREGRSVNALVVEVLSEAMGGHDPRSAIRARARVAGRLAEPPRPRHVPSRQEALEATRGVGSAASDALAAERAAG